MMDDIDIEISRGETPSRSELLSMVRRHSDFLKEGMIDEYDDCDVDMDGKFWHEMLDLYFIRSKESKGREEDDMVFFVRNMNLHGVGFNDDLQDRPPYFVRRWAPQLEKVIGESSTEVDWRRSFYLNLIAHTSFSVTVAICSVQALQKYQNGTESSVSPIYKVVKTVFASPNRVTFQLDSQKGTESVPSYPDICFAVDDFDDTFDDVILSERDHCYCVLLNAHGGAAFPAEEVPSELASQSSGNQSDTRLVKKSKITLFSGFVSYPMVREAYDAGRPRFGSLISIVHPQRADRLYMRGPGGRGEVEVAVSSITDQSQKDSGPHSPLQLSKAGIGIGLGTIMRRAASVASEAAKHAYATASSQKLGLELVPLKCCLMSISLPWEHLAHDLLFKVSPPVKL